MAFGPMPEDRTQVGGLTSSQNQTDTDRGQHDLDTIQRDEDTRNRKAGRQAYLKQQEKDTQPVTQNSPTKVHVPGWKVIVLGGSGGIRVRA